MIYRTAPIGLAVLDRNLRFVRINERLAEINGLPVEAHIGRTVHDIVPLLTSQIETVMHRIIETGEPWRDVEFVGETPARPGVSRTWLAQWHPVYDESRQITGVSVVVEDITERKRIELRYQELFAQTRSESERLRSVFTQAPSFIAIVTGPEHRFEFVNDKYLELFGDRGYVGKTVAEAFPEIADQGFVGLLDHVYTTGERYVASATPAFVRREVDAEPTERFLDLIFAAMRDVNGTVTGVFIDGYEVTERFIAERHARESQARLRLAMQVASLGEFEVDGQTLQLRWDRNALRMFGYTDEQAQEIELHDPIQRVHQADRERVARAVADAMDPSKVAMYRETYRVTWPDGTLRWVHAVGAGLFEMHDGARKCVRFVGMLHDITELQGLIAELRDADQRKDEFLAMLAHELRNPLAPLTNALRVLERTEPLTVRGQGTVTMAQCQTRQLQRLVDDLLEVSRITRGTIELKPESVSIGAAIHNAVEAITPDSERRRHRLRLVLPQDPIRIHADPVRIAQILENLLNNACKYTPDGGEIRIEVRSDADTVEVRVIDNGIGIDPAKQVRLFQLFHQVDAASDRAAGGLGIGLAMVKRLAELHGGTVDCESAGLGTGSTFTVRLPRRAVIA